ncbi:MAG: hypothetical protein KTR25_08810 [Myxococcales bacterium]|nr:hypothetical protein [Myxococcales bacterium]
MGWVIREVSFPGNAPDEEGAYRAYATDERRSEAPNSLFRWPARPLSFTAAEAHRNGQYLGIP